MFNALKKRKPGICLKSQNGKLKSEERNLLLPIGSWLDLIHDRLTRRKRAFP